MFATSAVAQDHKLRVQNHFSAESTPGQLIARFASIHADCKTAWF